MPDPRVDLLTYLKTGIPLRILIFTLSIDPISLPCWLVSNPYLEYDKGLNLFDALDMSDGLFIGRNTELVQIKDILLPEEKGYQCVTDSNSRVLDFPYKQYERTRSQRKMM